MKKILPAFFRNLLCSGLLLLMISGSAYASHILGAELRYRWVTGLTYQVTVVLYGDCSSTTGAFSTLPSSNPQVCLYDGSTYLTSINLPVQAPTTGLEVTPVCPDSLAYTTCTSLSYDIPGIMKFVYTNTVTLSHNSATWRFIYEGNNPGGSAAGRTSAITNLFNPGSTIMGLIDTLNTETTRGHNSSPLLTVEPTPFFCGFTEDCYNPGATDIYDTSSVTYHEPSGDSLVFHLTTPVNGTGAGCSPTISYCTYVPALDAWTIPTTQPIDGAHPIQCTSGATFSFDSSTGQLCFEPIEPQRSTVLYNIDEYFHDPVLGIVECGTIQREMNFLVEACTYTHPLGTIDSLAGSGDTSSPTNYFACQYSGDFSMGIAPRESDTTLTITVTATGLVTGLTCVITNNGTNIPDAVITGNTNIMTPGNYTVYLTYQDNHCPLAGSNTIPFTITVLPVPTISYALVAPATCNSKAAYTIIPGGTGKPWTVKVSVGGIVGDTIGIFTDTASFLDSLAPGNYHITIFTSTSNLCNVDTALTVPFANFVDTLTYTNPTYCGSPTGTIVMQDLLPFAVDSIEYQYNGQWVPTTGFVVTGFGTDTVNGLLAGTYDSIFAVRGYCHSKPIGPYTLVNPPFTISHLTTTNPTKYCFCDGSDTIFGLHPGQLDSIYYDFTCTTCISPVPQAMLIRLVGADSLVYMTNLCAGYYSNMIVRTDSVCSTSIGPLTLVAPPQTPDFYTFEKYGCKSDTIQFTNSSIPSTGLTYRWDFGDGTTDTAKSPNHVYYNIVGMTYSVTLTISNGICDSVKETTLPINNYIHSAFTFAPDPFVCQGSMVTFNDSSSGMGRGASLSYYWNFGDGSTSNSFNTTHTYPHTGAYNIQLIAANDIPCYDTSYGSIQVDSMSPLTINASDSVICRGSEVTFTGIYTNIGDTQVNWSFGDNNTILNVNPVMHSFDATGTLTVTLNALYRACPATSTTQTIQVYPAPDVYVGGDSAMCPGSAPIELTDLRNQQNAAARWLWNTGETTSSIAVKKPGVYYVVVTIDGCSSADTVNVVNNCYLTAPNIFTPNGDGVNDYFFPRQMLAKDLTSFSMNIFNRWGQEVFSTTSLNGRGWDGNLNNIPQPEGVYIYKIDATFGDGQVEHHQGNITLIR